VLVNHRRSGKDLDTWNKVICQAATTVGIYYYIFPTFAQARKVIWEGMDKGGRPFFDYIPKCLIEGTPRDDEMKVKIKTIRGDTSATSIIQLVGSDNYDHLMGTNPRFIVFSEYSLQNPKAWLFFRPILAENNGVAMFIFTPRGDNHGKEIYDMAVEQIEKKHSKDWYVERMTADQTWYFDEKGVKVPAIHPDRIQQDRDEGVPEEHIQQEYFCSFNSGNFGAYYADLIEKAEKEKRIGLYPHDPAYSVNTFWDLGFGDNMTIWFGQFIMKRWQFIDFYSNHTKPLEHYVRVLKDKDYTYGSHVGPFDLKNETAQGGGVSLWEQAKMLGVRFETAPKLTRQEGFETVRKLLMTCVFNYATCSRGKAEDNGIICLKAYHKKWDEQRHRFGDSPVHDWASDCADAFRTGAAWIFGRAHSDGVRRVIVPTDWKIDDYVSNGMKMTF
jgi:hypothetical protein